MFLLAHYEATLYFSCTKFTCPLITYTSYVQVNSFRLKSIVASKWASKHLWGYHLFCCLWYICLTFSTLDYSMYTKKISLH